MGPLILHHQEGLVPVVWAQHWTHWTYLVVNTEKCPTISLAASGAYQMTWLHNIDDLPASCPTSISTHPELGFWLRNLSL